MRFDPRAQCDSTRGPSAIRLFNRLLTQWDSTLRPSGIQPLDPVGVDPSTQWAQWDSPIKSPVDPVGFDPRAQSDPPMTQWDSTRGPTGIRPEGPVGFAYLIACSPSGIRPEGPVGFAYLNTC